ncbi:hypothetical protein scyTo_0011942, partial [Scyliorhinus torazame]|nr:hypothetical protein [Scyliorhinus torazame]
MSAWYPGVRHIGSLTVLWIHWTSNTQHFRQINDNLLGGEQEMTEEIAQTYCIDVPDASTEEEQGSTGSTSPASEISKFVIEDQQETLEELENSAKIIQRAWRRHIDRQVFKHYKDIINFRGQGNPQFMMKCINPIE